METTSEHRGIEDEQVDLQRLTTTYLYGKRCFDVIASGIALVLLSGVFLIISILIKLDDPHGKIFYSQTRLGKDGRKFQMWKFRSMVADADKMVDKLLSGW